MVANTEILYTSCPENGDALLLRHDISSSPKTKPVAPMHITDLVDKY